MNDWGDTSGRSSNVTKILSVFKDFSYKTIFKKKKESYNNLIITLNTSIMSMILFFEAALCTYKEYYGEEISCAIEEPHRFAKAKFIDYCWLDGSFTIPTDTPDSLSSFNGVSSMQVEDGSKFYHRYYPWVYLTLSVQSIMFYSIKWAWQSGIDARFLELIKKINKEKKNLYQYSAEEQVNLVQTVADLLFSNVPFYNTVVFAEMICLVHLIVQIWATDRFLNGNFHRLGILWLESSYNVKSITSLFLSPSSSSEPFSFNAHDPLTLIFPRMVKCTLKLFGPGGDFSSYDGLCFLATNALNEKIYLFQWFWYHFTLLIIIIILIWRALILLIPPIRAFSLSYTGSSYVARSYSCCLSSPGNWFLLHSLSSSMPTSHFIDLMDAVVQSHYDKYGNPLFNSKYGQMIKDKEITVASKPEQDDSNNAECQIDDNWEIKWPPT